MMSKRSEKPTLYFWGAVGLAEPLDGGRTMALLNSDRKELGLKMKLFPEVAPHWKWESNSPSAGSRTLYCAKNRCYISSCTFVTIWPVSVCVFENEICISDCDCALFWINRQKIDKRKFWSFLNWKNGKIQIFQFILIRQKLTWCF